jgi:hypothetical protein
VSPISTLDRWTERACAELGIDPSAVDLRAVLDLARDTARGVDRPAAPVTAYLLGVAVGSGEPLAGTVARLRELAQAWQREQQQPPA